MKYYLPDYNFAVEKYKGGWIMLHKGSDAVLATTPEQTEAILQWAENNKKKYAELVELSLKELGAHLQIRWNKTDDPEWPLGVVYKLFKQSETKELDRLLAKESYPKLAPCRTITGEKYAQIPGVWKERIKADAETMALPVYVVDIDGDPIKWNG
ncbi:MAG: hypothetical protein ING36_01775 [Burkholderiales bacterium]|jgi:hypothetical protein|uniref:hypothetical protein n=1 Tax=unclassified Microcystis TaxID=2643300 RepID=UPI0025850B0C|nr:MULTISPECIES: hypothetical protein [unclassified Microcystis]MCA2927748.1 hypothetical protein [Microcystis sp. M020S1]MCA3159285.1 hypothetical protein [Burkholderiales bacterium]MCA2910141.1 hypothetical protein [Microcystis sp. M034S1]MCA2931929.1 hypothetical protein [Microcystis sp. M018S1]MCA3160563.1 hypothetical protein [Burkholderiales bacterium]